MSTLLCPDFQEKILQDCASIDYAVNCAGETRFGLTDAIYNEGIVSLTTACATFAANCKVKRFIEISSGCMASSSKVEHITQMAAVHYSMM